MRRRKVVGSGRHDRIGTARRGSLRQCHALLHGRVGDSHEHGHPARNERHNPLDELPLHGMRERRPFTGGSKDEQSMDATADDVLHEPLEPLNVE